jgi:tetratricopeptide (TPR) repeat protein
MPGLLRLFRASFLVAIVLVSVQVYGQAPACRAVEPHPLSPAETAYKDSSYAQAEQLYAQALGQQPHDAAIAARYVETLIHENKVAQAAEQVKSAIAAHPNSAAVLTAQAEVQLREGEPWLAMKSLDAAAAADGCYARVHLVRSRIFHIDSMYASERSELQKAYDMDATDPDIVMEWSRIMPAAKDIEGTAEALGRTKDLETKTRAKAEATIASLRSVLHEDTQTCRVLPTVSSASVPLLPSREDGKHIDSFRLEVKFPKATAKLVLDTAASGLYISKALADENGFQRAADAPMGTVQASTLQIGPLEFRDCMVGVSDVPFAGKADGFIGTDLLAKYLITIDGNRGKLDLDPLPAEPGVLPGDRATGGELGDYDPVYHRRQYLLVPVMIDNKARKLFALDTGMRMSAMGSETAHAVSNTKVNFTNPLQTKSGQAAQVYRDSFDLDFAGVSAHEKSGSVLEFNPGAIGQNAGFDVAGLLGLDVLGQMTLHLDYRDGLVKLELASKEENAKRGGTETERAECPTYEGIDIPIKQTLELRVTGTLDSGRLKPGKEIFGQVVHGLIYPGCTLDANAIVYGHVTAVSSSRNPDQAELGLVFDHGDCEGHPRTPLSLHLIALLPPPDEDPNSLHGALPTEVAGGVRQISVAVAESDAYDAQLSEGGKPHTVHPGVVVGIPRTKLEPAGGPACSARITSSSRSVQLGTGAEMILTMSTVKAPGGSH